jgi:prepilin-type N-terminal cleavage/methylation domain-containing protein
MSIDDVQTPLEKEPTVTRRSGFTLVELLAVIMIIALLAGLLTPAVMRSLNSARNAAIRAEIDLLHTAIMNYKNEYGSFPPSIGVMGSTNFAYKHLKRNFARASDAALPGLPLAGRVTPSSSLLSWLGGYTDDPTDPLALLNTSLTRKRLFDWDRARTDTTGLLYFPNGKKGSPYIYINSSSYSLLDSGSGTFSRGWPPADVPYQVGQDSFKLPAEAYYPTRIPNSATDSQLWKNPARQYFNSDTFQILCAGQDEEFGTDDDLSNFWPGTRKLFLDSLK